MGAHRRSVTAVTRLSAALLALAATAAVRVAAGAEPEAEDPNALTVPKTHFKIERPADMFPNAAETVYQNIRARIAAGYALARIPRLRNYLAWRRFNKAPYRSATHGARYVNNYANRTGQAYGAFEEAGRLPEGAILVKDSFTATADGGIYPGPMFVMEKMAPGFNLAGGDWRYTMIMPDGSVFGETNGVNTENVAFCNGCHATRAATDYLFFLPQAYRITPLETDP